MLWLGACLAPLSLTGCGEGGPTAGEIRPVVLVGLTPVTSSIATGATVQLGAFARDREGRTIPDAGFAFASSDSAVAHVSATGLVTGRKAGAVSVTVTVSSGQTAAVSVFVTAVPAPVRVRYGGADVRATRTGPAFLLQGSGAPTPSAVSRVHTLLGGAPIDVVVLSASLPTSGSRTPECDVMIDVASVNSCETITITDRTGADDPLVRLAIDAAELVYFAGGDQCRYVAWAGSTLMTGVRTVIGRGGAVGGGSAGLAIQGEFVHDGCAGSPSSATALRDPFAASIGLSSGFFAWTPLSGVITDSHFVARDRMGRLLSFLSRLTVQRARQTLWGVGVDEGAAVVIDRAGEATFVGGATFVVRSATSTVASPGVPLDASGFLVRRFAPGDSWSFVSRPLTGFWTRDVQRGVLQGNAYSP